jgi:aquaporin Z
MVSAGVGSVRTKRAESCAVATPVLWVQRNRTVAANIELSTMDAFRSHWREYAAECACLALFMMSAAICATLLQHPGSPLASWTGSGLAQRMAMGAAMGLTAAAIIYSPLGARSGAHMNPAVTLTFLRLRKVSAADALWYLAAQFLGGAVGILAAERLLGGLLAHPSVNFVATLPGRHGAPAAFAAEAVISFGLMLTVLHTTNNPRLMRLTGVFAGALVAFYIVAEAPLSGMSMNPARSFAPALLSHTARTVWIYFAAPPLGMFTAGELFVRRFGRHRIACAKLHHPSHIRCIFACSHRETQP